LTTLTVVLPFRRRFWGPLFSPPFFSVFCPPLVMCSAPPAFFDFFSHTYLPGSHFTPPFPSLLVGPLRPGPRIFFIRPPGRSPITIIFLVSFSSRAPKSSNWATSWSGRRCPPHMNEISFRWAIRSAVFFFFQILLPIRVLFFGFMFFFAQLRGSFFGPLPASVAGAFSRERIWDVDSSPQTLPLFSPQKGSRNPAKVHANGCFRLARSPLAFGFV